MKRITTLNEIDFILLGSLLDGPAYGYDLLKRNNAEVSRSQVYHSLAKMHRYGLLNEHSEEVVGAPTRRIFEIASRQRQRIHRLLLASMTEVSDVAQDGLRQYHVSHDSAGKLQEMAFKLLRASGNQFRV